MDSIGYTHTMSATQENKNQDNCLDIIMFQISECDLRSYRWLKKTHSSRVINNYLVNSTRKKRGGPGGALFQHLRFTKIQTDILKNLVFVIRYCSTFCVCHSTIIFMPVSTSPVHLRQFLYLYLYLLCNLPNGNCVVK